MSSSPSKATNEPKAQNNSAKISYKDKVMASSSVAYTASLPSKSTKNSNSNQYKASQSTQSQTSSLSATQSAAKKATQNASKAPLSPARMEIDDKKLLDLTKENLTLTSSDYYADSYAHFGIHEEMLQDDVRTVSYMNAIQRNPHLFKDKVVLDVGCGTGILSMFAARAGARLVIGVDMSAIAEQAKVIVKLNKLDNVVKIIRGKIEEIELPAEVADGKVDIIISEWMGYFLLYESMLDSVLFARDKFLKKDGLLFPDKASMYICGIEDADYRQKRMNFWDNVYGFDMSCMKDIVLTEALVDTVEENSVMTNSCKLIDIDLNTVKKEDLDFHAPFTLLAHRQDFCYGFTVYFDIVFSKCHSPVYFTTKPGSPYTHWKQTTFWLRDVLTVCDREKIIGSIKCNRNARNPRDLDIEIDYQFQGKHQQVKNSWKYRVR